ncbi:MAG TPA: hypothetical protein VH062_16365 [Polyangiaceae bacterium]|jgi:hypothetical protein|nr:hypothetical protein [Polyangiaceae bacterium]
MTPRSSLIVLLLVAIGCALGSCSEAPSDARVGVIAPNASEEAFGPVADFLDHRCGTLDCHGQPGRNLRIWGCEGMRLLITDASICSRKNGGQPTSPAEHQATYRSLVGLEPTVMSEVVADHGRDPELLTFIRKARGTESHKGGVLFTPGDDQDVCVTSWLAGKTNLTACSNAFSIPTFPSLPSQ